MSKSLSSLKNRRVNFADNSPPPPGSNTCSLPSSAGTNKGIAIPPPPSSPNDMSRGLTLPQVIQIVDKRLILLEKFMNTTLQKEAAAATSTPSPTTEKAVEVPPASSVSDEEIKEIISEFDKRCDILAEEIGNLKDIVLSLQSYTMSVNKLLMDERARIFSELQDQPTPEEESCPQPVDVDVTANLENSG